MNSLISKIKYMVLLGFAMLFFTSVPASADISFVDLGKDGVNVSLGHNEVVCLVFTAPEDGYYARELEEYSIYSSKETKFLYRYFNSEQEAIDGAEHSFSVDWKNSFIKLKAGQKIYIDLVNFSDNTVTEQFKFIKKDYSEAIIVDYELKAGNVSWNPETLVLTLDNAEIHKFSINHMVYGEYIKIKIIVKGYNRVNWMVFRDLEVTFAGDGVLDIMAKDSTYYGIGLNESKMIVDGAKINIYSKDCAIDVYTVDGFVNSFKVGVIVRKGELNMFLYPKNDNEEQISSYTSFVENLGDLSLEGGVMNFIFVDDGNMYYDNVEYPEACIVDKAKKTTISGDYDYDIYSDIEMGLYYDENLLQNLEKTCDLVKCNGHVEYYSGLGDTEPELVLNTRMDISSCNLEFDANSGIGEDGNIIVTGSEICPKVVVSKDVNGSKVVFEEGKDYTVAYENNVEVGVAKVIVTGNLGCHGVKEITFNIISNEEISGNENENNTTEDNKTDVNKNDDKKTDENNDKIDDGNNESDDVVSSKVFTKGKYRYKIIKDPSGKKKGKVILLGFKNKKGSKKIIIAKKIKYKGKVYVITKIKKKAFYKKKKVKKVIIKATKIKKIGKYAFKGINKKAKIKVPKKKYKKYKKLLKKAKVKNKVI